MIKACVLRSGGDFGPEHVQWLARQVPGLVCLSDVAVPGIETIPLQHDWPGWWAKMEMFGPSIAGDVLMIDLDTVVFSVPDQPLETTVLLDFSDSALMGSGLMYVTECDRARVWDAWIASPEKHMRDNQRWPKWGDQGFLQDHIGNCQKWQDIAGVYSYKAHCRSGVPDGAQVVCFHGKPRPWGAKDAWIPPLFGGIGDFRDLIKKHAGKRFVVMGGGPSLARDMERIEKADVVISTNGHGVEIRQPDYLLAIDHTHTGRQMPMGQYLRRRSSAPIISPHAFADYRLGFWPLSTPNQPRFILSGMVAAWAAFAMGAKCVTLAGMDGYPDNDYRELAGKIARDIHCPVRVMPESFLRDVWPVYDASERLGKYKPHSSIDGMRGIDNTIRIRAVKPCNVGLVELSRGHELTVMRHEVARLLRHRLVEEI